MLFSRQLNINTLNIGSVVALFIGLVAIASIIEASYLNSYLLENVDLGIIVSSLPLLLVLFAAFFTNISIILVYSTFFIS